MSKEEMLVKSLANLLEWAKGNRGDRGGSPYRFKEVQDALKTLGQITDDEYTGDWLSVDTKKLSG